MKPLALALRAVAVASAVLPAFVASAATPPGRIVFDANFTEGTDHLSHYEIFTISPNGGGLTQVTREPADCLNPDLSPDGTKVVFFGGVSGHINVINSDGTGLTPLSALDSISITRVAWSPDGTKLACAGTNLGVCNADGSGYVQLSSNLLPNGSQHPTWSPDGTKFAVSGNDYSQGGRPSSDGIYVVAVNGQTPVRRLTGYDHTFDYPAWSPDGTKIACNGISQDYGLYTVDPTTGATTLVTSFPANKGISTVSWSPDGSRLCGQAQGDNGVGLITINPDDTAEIDLPTGQCIEPRWSNAGGVSGDSITVSGYANVYNADLDTVDASAADSLDIGTQPVSIDVFNQAGSGSVTFPSVTGSVFIDENNDNGGQGANGPEGGSYFAPEYISALHGISGYALPKTGALIGVYLAYSYAQSDATAPANLDFTANGLGTDFTALSPALGQVFFIGDGHAADGTLQKFNIPAGATILLLGTADGGTASTAPATAHGYTDNGGSFNATFAYDTIGLNTGGGVTNGGTADLKLAITGSSDTVNVGNQITYTITITNHGPNASSNIRGGFAGPTSFTYVSSTNAMSVSGSGNAVTFVAPNLASGASEQVTLTFRADAAGNFVVVAGLQEDQTDPTPTDANGSANTTVLLPGSSAGTADLTLTVTDSPDPVTVGGQVKYTFTLVNHGPDTATNIQGSFVKDSRMTFVPSGSQVDVTVSVNTLTFPLPPLASGASETYTLIFSPTAAGVFYTAAGVQADQADPHTADNGLIETTEAVASGTVTGTPAITGAAHAQVLVGDAFAYQIATDGSVPISGYSADGLPTGLSVDPQTGLISGKIAGGTAQAGDITVTLHANNGSAQGSATLTLTVVEPPDGKAADVTGTLKKLSVKLAGGGTSVKLTGQYKLKNLGSKAAKNLKVGVYLAKSAAFTFPVSDDAAAAGLQSLDVKLTAELDDNGAPVYGVKVALPKAGEAAPLISLPIKLVNNLPVVVPLAAKGKEGSSFALNLQFKGSTTDLPAQVIDGDYRYLLIVLDPQGAVPETSKSNNTMVVDLQALLKGL